MARQRQTTAEAPRLAVEASDADAARVASAGPDPRLLALVRLLARQAARDFVAAETEGPAQDHLPD